MTTHKAWISGACAGLAAAAVPLFLLRGFTVDDALIPARYAAHLAAGLGYRYNAQGPVTDGVTALGWAHLLAPFAKGGALHALGAARLIGAGAWLFASAWLGATVAASSERRARWAALLVVLASAPLGAWAISGMETGLVLALATAAVCLPPQPRFAAGGGALAGAVAWLRPEALPFAMVLGFGRARSAQSWTQRVLALAGAGCPFLLVVALRMVLFGRPYPLALIAKPSDLAHGAAYAAAALLLSGGPVLVGSVRLTGFDRAVALAVVAHAAAIAIAGGDWMPLSRLFVPAVPALVLLAAHALPSRPAAAWAALALALAGQIYAAARVGPAAARVLSARLRLMDAACPAVARLGVVATVDVGWVGACSEADVIDLSGVTDPEIAALGGGHTSKRVTLRLLEQRRVEGVVVWIGADPGDPRRIVEKRLVAEMRGRYELAYVAPPDLPTRYAIYMRR